MSIKKARKKGKIYKQIVESEAELFKIRRKEKIENEEKVIDCMKENPKMLFSYEGARR